MDRPSRISTEVLPNGLRLCMEIQEGNPLVALNLWYCVGSRNEVSGKTGFAHLFEHLLFEGSQHVQDNQHFLYLEQVGAYVNGSTWYDRTNYYETLPVPALPLALWLESDRMGFFLEAFTKEKLDLQRDVVKNERRFRVDNQPYGDWDERLFEMAFPENHPYHHPVIGYMEDLDHASLEDVTHFFLSYYHPQNAILTLVGGIDEAMTREWVYQWFGNLPHRNTPSLEPPIGDLPLQGELILKKPVPFPRLYVLYHTPPFPHPQARSGELLTNLLGEGKSSRLYQYLVVERGIALDVQMWFFPLELSGVMVGQVTFKKGISFVQAKEAWEEAFFSLESHPPSKEELQKATGLARLNWLQELDDLTERANFFSMAMAWKNDPCWIFEAMDALNHQTLEDGLAFYKSYISPPKGHYLFYEPIESP